MLPGKTEVMCLKKKNYFFKTNPKEILQEKTAGLFCIIKGCFILGA
jgi:hypothetical protein